MESFKKLCMYKTAYSPLLDCYVEIVKVYLDYFGEPIIKARPAFNTDYFLFRQYELVEYVL